jgi:hypothetical protein
VGAGTFTPGEPARNTGKIRRTPKYEQEAEAVMSKNSKNMSKRSPWRRLLPLAFVASAFTLFVAGTAVADTTTTSEPSVEFSLEPSTASSQPSGYFVLEAKPGDTVEQSATLRNLTKNTITVQIAPVDAMTGLYGGVTYALPTDTAKAAGTWIKVSQGEVTLESGATVEVPFTVNVPNDAPTGVSIGALTAWVPAKKDMSSTTTSGFGAQIIIQTRRVVAVKVTTPGDAEPVLVINGIKTTARASGMELDIDMANTGHGLASGSGSIDIPATGFHKDFTLGDVVPGTSMGYPIQWVTDPDKGTYDTKVSVTYNGKTAAWSGSFTIGETAVSELKDYVTTTTEGKSAAAATGGISTTTIIIIVVAGVAWLIIVAVVAWLVIRLSRRRQPPGPRE